MVVLWGKKFIIRQRDRQHDPDTAMRSVSEALRRAQAPMAEEGEVSCHIVEEWAAFEEGVAVWGKRRGTHPVGVLRSSNQKTPWIYGLRL